MVLNKKINFKIFLRSLLVLFCAVSSVSCSNFFKAASSKTFDAAVYYEAQRDIDKGDYSSAISKIENDLSTTYQERRDVKLTRASAYAARCGLNTISFIESLSNGSGNLLNLLYTALSVSTTTNVDDCEVAENILISISSNASGRTSDENYFMLFISMAKMGAILSATGDQDGNEAIDGTYDPCAGNADLTNELTNKFIVSLAVAIDALSVATLSGVNFGGLSTLCTDLGIPTLCDIRDPNDGSIDGTMRAGARCVITEDQGLGLNINADGDYATCAGTCSTL